MNKRADCGLKETGGVEGAGASGGPTKNGRGERSAKAGREARDRKTAGIKERKNAILDRENIGRGNKGLKRGRPQDRSAEWEDEGSEGGGGGGKKLENCLATSWGKEK